MENILFGQLKMSVISEGAAAYKGRRRLAVDVLAYDNDNTVCIVKIVYTLRRDDISQILETIEEFPKFFRLFAGRAIYGIIAAHNIPKELRDEVLNEGFYLARVGDGIFRLQVPRGFKPKAFEPTIKARHKSHRPAKGRARKE
ncbi:MAG: hypothetical protein ACREAM_21385 [Blastocatellia bacterium]